MENGFSLSLSVRLPGPVVCALVCQLEGPEFERSLHPPPEYERFGLGCVIQDRYLTGEIEQACIAVYLSYLALLLPKV